MKIFGFEFNFGNVKNSLETETDFVPIKKFTEKQKQIMAYNGQQLRSAWENSLFDGGKFAGGFGVTQNQTIDYPTLRMRSTQLFNENLYAKGLIRRLITNEINTGLSPDAIPDEEFLGMSEDDAYNWSEKTENLFSLWWKNPSVCDWYQSRTFGELQRSARTEALISGDVLVVLRQSNDTKLPMVQLVSGAKIKTPWNQVKLKKGHEIKHGVEFDKNSRVVAYWIEQDDYEFTRLVANSAKTGRRISWLVYGTEKRIDHIRGMPLLSIVLQSLKEIDRYRDSAQRKATINAMLAMFIRKNKDKMGSLPMQGAAVRNDQFEVADSDGTTRNFNVANQIPGVVFDELQDGEEPIGFNSAGTDIDFQKFEETIIQAVAWANEVPPEIMRLSFSNNYSASQAAINEFKIYLNKTWNKFGDEFCQPIYNDWVYSQVLLDNIEANGFIEAWNMPEKFETLGSWLACDWFGSIKPSTDMLKTAKGSELLVKNAWSTNAREARNITGTKFTKNIKKLKRENELLVEALKPMKEFDAQLEIQKSQSINENMDQSQVEGENNARFGSGIDGRLDASCIN